MLRGDLASENPARSRRVPERLVDLANYLPVARESCRGLRGNDRQAYG